MIINLGISPNFGAIDFEHLTFPTVMSIDYVRVYQRPEDVNTGCDPDNFPTQSYINKWVSSSVCLLGRRLMAFFSAPYQVPRGIHEPEPHDMGERFRTTVPEEPLQGRMLTATRWRVLFCGGVRVDLDL